MAPPAAIARFQAGVTIAWAKSTPSPAASADAVCSMAPAPPKPSPQITAPKDFLRSLMRRGLRGVKLVISDAHEGLKAAVSKVFHATWQRCRVHFMRNAMAHVGNGHRTMVAALLRTVFAQDSRQECLQQRRLVADQLREKYPKIAALMDGCEDEVLAHMAFPH